MGAVNPEVLCHAGQAHLAWLGNHRKDGGENEVVKMPYRKHFLNEAIYILFPAVL